jgi:hypothetical protein
MRNIKKKRELSFILAPAFGPEALWIATVGFSGMALLVSFRGKNFKAARILLADLSANQMPLWKSFGQTTS